MISKIYDRTPSTFVLYFLKRCPNEDLKIQKVLELFEICAGFSIFSSNIICGINWKKVKEFVKAFTICLNCKVKHLESKY